MAYYDYDDLVDEYYGGGGYYGGYAFLDFDWEPDEEEEDEDRMFLSSSDDESDDASSSSESVIAVPSSSKAFSTAAKTPKDTVYCLQLERYEIFKAQDNEKGHFDIAIEIGGKKLFVHKFFLASASEYFNALFSVRWGQTKEDTIKIANPDYSYGDIYELLTFIYSGSCSITNSNIFVLTDMSEFYGIQLLKERCIEFLSSMNIVVEDIEKMLEIAQRYSLTKFIESLKVHIERNMKVLIESEQWLDYKKPFIEFMSTVEKNSVLEEAFFDAAYKWAQHHAAMKGLEARDEDFDYEECIEKELDGILGNITFSLMSLKFVKASLLEKRFLFSPKKLYKIILKSQKGNDEDDDCFKTLYEAAKCVATETRNTTNDELSVRKIIKQELADILPKVKFFRMTVKFLSDFVVERKFTFSFARLHDYLLNCRQYKNEEAFKAVYQLAEKQVMLKQKSSIDAKFCLINAVKKELIEVISKVEFSKMNVEFWMNFAIEKGFVLLPSDFKGFFDKLRWSYRNPQELFKIIYQLAEKQVLKKKYASEDKNFNIYEVIKSELSHVLPHFEFAKMKLEFLMESVVEKGLLLSATLLKDFYLQSQKHYGNCEDAFKDVYKLAEKQAKEEQKGSGEKAFNLVKSIKDELVVTIPVVEFYRMSKKFLNDFVVEVKSDGTKICGIFEDVYGIMKAVPSKGYFTTPRQWNKIRFAQLKFKISIFPISIVQKMKGVEWYLCLERDGVLTIKFHTLIATNDFLLSEMKTSDDFMFNTEESACLTACFNNI
uniref:BTB domain-containing protein n=1 Tax=Panagrolaimus sp. ES5 TaxID=591445 RepID=A0AC34FB58_9BILA